MWAKFEVVPSDGDIIYLPLSWSDRLGESVSIRFGTGNTVRAAVIYSKELQLREYSTYEEPGVIRISNSVCNQLLVQTSLVYQIKIVDSCIIIGPIIGILLGVHSQHYNPKHMKKYSDRMGIYNKIGGLIYAFSPKTVNWEKHQAFGLFYNIVTAEWEYGCFPLPEVIYRRDFHSNPKYIKRLTEITDGRLFNSYRFTKMEMYNYLSKQEKIKRYLPPTELSLNFEQVTKFVDRYRKVILKPVDLSRGRGICIIEKYDTFYQITDYRYKYPSTTVINSLSDFEQYFRLNQSFFSKYLIQKYLNLARINTSIFDIRVVMQKRKDKVWGCTGVECRVSKDSHITNISRGGYALTLQETLEKAFAKDCKEIAVEIDTFCYEVCKEFDQMGHHFAEFGLDIAVDENKDIWLIEANVFPSFKGFKKIDRKTYLAIRYTPLLYAMSLSEFGDKDDEYVD